MRTNLEYAKEMTESARESPQVAIQALNLVVAMEHLIAHLKESAQETPLETPSPEATETEAGVNHSLPISWRSLCRVSPSGFLQPYPLPAISDLLSSLRIHGHEQVEVTLSIHTSKGSIPPGGSPSQSTEAAILDRNGHAGEETP
jgi:hypothetical protein